MRKPMLAALLLLPASASAQSLLAGRWGVTSTVVDLKVPGVPGFIQRMAKGKAKTEEKCLPPAQTVAALLAPDPKAQCRIDAMQIADGRYSQMLSCPQKKGDPFHIARAGAYDGNGFAGRAYVTGVTAKGPVSITLDQRAARTAGNCAR